MAAIPLRADFDAQQLRLIAKRTKDGPQARRLLALAGIYDGALRSEAATIGGVTLQVIRDWVLRFNRDGPDGLINGKAPGQPSRLTAANCATGSPGRCERTDPGHSWRRALANHRPLPVAARGASGHGIQADAEPGTARDRLSQAVGSPAPSCATARGNRRF